MNKLYTLLLLVLLSLNSVTVSATEVIPNKYIVVFKAQAINNDGEVIREAAERLINEVQQNQLLFKNKNVTSSSVTNALGFVYENAIQGFSAALTPDGVNYLKQNTLVDYIEQDSIMSANVIQQPTPSWGLDRVDQRNLPLDTVYGYNYDGSGVHAYIIDTGIHATHNEFSGRVGSGYDFIDNDANPNDCNGHGTHVSGTVGGTTYGVSKNVTVHGVKVLSCDGSGSTSGVIAGINWVRNNAILPAVINMSLGGGDSQALDTAVNNAVAAGITVVVAAGNDYGQDACNKSPARAANAVTVASVSNNDYRSSFSNIGTCVDIFAPGSGITSAWHISNTATKVLSGTSMASPHVAGVATVFLGANSSATPAQVTASLIAGSTKNKVSDAGSGTPNRLLYSNLTNVYEYEDEDKNKWTGNVNAFLGQKILDKDDWSPIDKQAEFGVLTDFKRDYWPASVAIDFLGSVDKTTDSGIDFEGHTFELDVGVRKIWEVERISIRPYIGGGLAFINAEFKDSSLSDDDIGTGFWLGGGAYWTLKKSFNLGLDLRYSQADVTLFGKDRKAGGIHAGIMLGYHW